MIVLTDVDDRHREEVTMDKANSKSLANDEKLK
jgi:hypothetical protein